VQHCILCDQEFDPNSPKQIYCSAECRQKASKQKIIERYEKEKIKKRIGKERRCAGGCNTVLSIYNGTGMCDNCLEHKKKVNNFMKELKQYFEYEKD
jgi:hypothetical protein